MLSALATRWALFWLCAGFQFHPLWTTREAPAAVPGADLFAPAAVFGFTLDINAAGLEGLRERPRQWVEATLRFGTRRYEQVAVHVKGSQGSLQAIDARPALTVSFTRFAKGRKFHGLKKIHFNNSAEDPSYMTEILCSELCRSAGLPAARSVHATLTLNGRQLGLYVLKEGLTKEFLAQYFADPRGNLYDGGFRRDIDRPLARIGGHGPDDQRDRLALLQAVRERDLKRRWEKLRQVLDVDRFVSLLAMTTILWNWDGYPMARNNYRLYHDPLSDKLVFIPHGLDQMFWEPRGPIYPPMRGLVAVAFMELPQGQALYRERLARFEDTLFRVEALRRRVDELTVLIEPYRHDAARQGQRLKSLITARGESIAQQLRRDETLPRGRAVK